MGRLSGCRLATYGSYGGSWAGFGAVGWQPTGLMVVAGFGAVGWQPAGFMVVPIGRLWGCRLATYGSYGGWWAEFGAVGWRPTGLMVVAVLALGL